MSRRGASQLKAIAAVVEAFGSDADKFVVIGSCALALHARPAAPSDLRATRDVDCICLITPFTRLQRKLAHLSETGVLSPDQELLCRYRIRKSGTVVDIIDLDGRTTGKEDPWVRHAADTAQQCLVEGAVSVRAVTPPVFLAMKLSALVDRGPNEMCVDAEDIVTLAVEVEDLIVQVQAAGLVEEIFGLCEQARTRYGLSSLADLVDYHLDPRELEHVERVRSALTMLAREDD